MALFLDSAGDAAASAMDLSPRMVLATTGAVALALAESDTAGSCTTAGAPETRLSLWAKSLQPSSTSCPVRGCAAATDTAEAHAEEVLERVADPEAEERDAVVAEAVDAAHEADDEDVTKRLEGLDDTSHDGVVPIPCDGGDETQGRTINLNRGSPAAAAARFPIACATEAGPDTQTALNKRVFAEAAEGVRSEVPGRDRRG